jgi:hypothetical protein
MKKDLDIIGAQEEFERVFTQRIIGTYSPVSGSKAEFTAHLEDQLHSLTAAYRALTEFVRKDDLVFLEKKTPRVLA